MSILRGPTTFSNEVYILIYESHLHYTYTLIFHLLNDGHCLCSPLWRETLHSWQDVLVRGETKATPHLLELKHWDSKGPIHVKYDTLDFHQR